MSHQTDEFLGRRLVFMAVQQPYQIPGGQSCVSLAPILELDTGRKLEPRPAAFPGDGLVFWYDVSIGDLKSGDIVIGRLSRSEKHYESSDFNQSWFQVVRDDGYACGDDIFELCASNSVTLDDLRDAVRTQRAVQVRPKTSLPFYINAKDGMVGPFVSKCADRAGLVVLKPVRSNMAVDVVDGFLIDQHVTAHEITCSLNNHKPGESRAEPQHFRFSLIRQVDLRSDSVTCQTKMLLSDDEVIARVSKLFEGRQNIRRHRDELQALLQQVSERDEDRRNGVFAGLESIAARVEQDDAALRTITRALMGHERIREKINHAATEAAKAEVRQRRKQIEFEAKENAASVVEEISQLKESCAEARAELADRKEELARLSAAESDHQQRMDAIVAATANRLAEQRTELLADAGLLSALIGAGTNLPAAIASPEQPAFPSGVVTRAPAIDGPELTEHDFLTTRLKPALANAGCAVTDLPGLYFTFTAAPIIQAPHPGWVKAYANAMGGTMDLITVPVEPNWLDFDTAWSRVSTVWQQAIDDSERLVFIGFEGVNRCPSDAWLRAFLNVACGWSDRLPEPVGLPWPENLRLFVTTIAGPESFDAPTDLNRWCPAIAAGDFSLEPAELASGHLPASTWLPSESQLESTGLLDEFLKLACPPGDPYRLLIKTIAARMIVTGRRLNRDPSVDDLLKWTGRTSAPDAHATTATPGEMATS